MYIPGHYVAIFAFFFIMQSTTIFVYTIIGLLKANPLPFIMPPTLFPMGQACPQVACPALAALVPAQNTGMVTTTVYATITPAQKQLPGLLAPGAETAIETSTISSNISASNTTSVASTSTSTVSASQSIVTSLVLTTKVVGNATPSQRSTVFLTTTVAS